ncbi:hypothetical protein BpHYR1_030122 [Brachionus plicatilis]|uniref:UPAR/Ly6 domain-containing protein n=1 Tax=Brachionus plicatilis TaxID=10195 RepID=A0A3M7RMB0_BRAPC|nr:hypothetical protein BpHYR1_030122 [Brachionus plicatilis]
MHTISIKNIVFCFMLSLAIAGYVKSLKCYYCEDCTGIDLKKPKTFKKAVKRNCSGTQNFCIRAEQKMTNSYGKEQMKVVALGCTTECNAHAYANTGLKASCCTKNLCNLPKKKGGKGKGKGKGKGRKYGRSFEESVEEYDN